MNQKNDGDKDDAMKEKVDSTPWAIQTCHFIFHYVTHFNFFGPNDISLTAEDRFVTFCTQSIVSRLSLQRTNHPFSLSRGIETSNLIGRLIVASISPRMTNHP